MNESSGETICSIQQLFLLNFVIQNQFVKSREKFGLAECSFDR